MRIPELDIHFPVAERSANTSDARLYSFGEIPSLDELGWDYGLHLIVRAADEKVEQMIADTCTRAINAAPSALAAMQDAYKALDSVAFLQTEGDTDKVKQALAAAIEAISIA